MDKEFDLKEKLEDIKATMKIKAEESIANSAKMIELLVECVKIDEKLFLGMVLNITPILCKQMGMDIKQYTSMCAKSFACLSEDQES